MTDSIPFPAGTMAKGISVRTVDVSAELGLTFDTYNVTHGIYIGSGPRYGFATIPGQMGTTAPAANALANMQRSEDATYDGRSFFARRKVFGVIPLSLPDPSDVTKRIQVYAFLFTYIYSSVEYLDIVFPATEDTLGGNPYEILSSNITNGFIFPSATVSNVSNFTRPSVFSEGIPAIRTSGFYDRFTPFLTSVKIALPDVNFISIASALGGGGNVPCQWMLGQCMTDGDATHAPNVNFYQTDNLVNSSAAAITVGCGVTTEYNLQTFTAAPRNMKIFTLASDGGLNIAYSVNFSPSATTFVSDINARGISALVLSGVTATKDTVGTTYTSSDNAIVHDPSSVINSSYKAIFAAGGSAYGCFFQDGYRAANSRRHNQWFDLSQNTFQAPTLNSFYTQNGTAKTKSCFVAWPTFARGTGMVTSAAGIGLAGASTGILRSNTVYEFTYSLYNKRLNFESNVGALVKFQTSATDFQALNLFDYVLISETQYKTFLGNAQNIPVPFIYDNEVHTDGSYIGTWNFINFLQYRFYFRAEGTFEWLPALFIDAAEYWFSPTLGKLAACSNALAASVGGQPGGFNDYSPLPKDVWNCVVVYRNRAFWLSPTQIQYSLYNNYFAYPGRNSAACPSGQFRGALLHNYPGQAEQAARLIIFGTATTYVGRFTGNRSQQSVQVSPVASGVFEVEGSDFVMDAWTNVTAFSYRSAVVADGILFWWGPQGIYRDDGVQTPTKISGNDLEPTIFTVYDPGKTDQIHAHYDEQTKDITWFYPPRTADSSVTHALVYNTDSGKFLRSKFTGKIDWVSNLNVESALGTAGKRGVAGVRDTASTTTQRAYFYDIRNRAGDLRPTHDMVVSSWSTPATGTRRLTLAAGYDATSLTTIAVGDTLALQQLPQYVAALTTATDMIATISAVSTGSGTIDITLPTGAVLSPGTATIAEYFPIYHKAASGIGLNGFSWQMESFYWAAGGIAGWFYWLYTYLFFKFIRWPSTTDPTLSMGYRSMTSVDYVTDTVTLVDNSDGNCQRYHRNQIGDENMEGQALRYKFSGIHIGNEWTLQLMQAENQEIDGNPLMQFEE